MDERPLDPGGSEDEGLQRAVRGLVESVNATSRQFAEAADAFARETIRVMDGLSSRLQGAAGESRDMAAMAGRSADEARRLSEHAEGIVTSAERGIREQTEAMLAEVRVQLDEALRSSAEAVAGARLAAGEAQQRNRETNDRVELVTASSRQAVTAAETAAEAARQSAESVGLTAAEARERLFQEASRMDQEAAARMEQSLVASREAAAAAERAAEDARSAALEAMTHAAEARTPALESAIGIGAQELLDRLEADYQLLTELVQSLHSRIAGLSGAAYVPPSQENRAPSPALDEPLAPAVRAEEPEPHIASPDPESAWNRHVAQGESTHEASLAGGTTWPTAEAIAAAPEPRDQEGATAGDPPSLASHAPWAFPPRAEEPRSWEETPSPAVESSPSVAASQDVGGESNDRYDATKVDAWPRVRLETAPEWQLAGAVAQPEAGMTPEAEDVPAAAEGPASAIGEDSERVTATNESQGESESPALVLAGRVVLNVAPVPDFDRLLSLDGALGRLGSVRNVTLADYAKEEVTFRVELSEATSVEDFTKDLGQMSSQSLEVMAVSPGHLQLRIVRAGN